MNTPSFKLRGVPADNGEAGDFEGPLSVILALLAKDKLEIREIRIADILEQYLSYISGMGLDLDGASEFVQMASHLVYIKARTLLTEEKEPPTELELLISSLEELQSREAIERIRPLIAAMESAYKDGAVTRPPEPLKPQSAPDYRHDSSELMRALLSVLTRGPAAVQDNRLMSITPPPVLFNVRDKGLKIVDILSAGFMRLTELYDGCSSRSELVATFLAVLELCSIGAAEIDGDTLNLVGDESEARVRLNQL